MRKALTIMAVMVVVFVLAVPSVMAQGEKPTYKYKHLFNFSYMYQWVRDVDGDGIPNGLDPDYVRPEDGSGYGRLGLAVGPGDGSEDTKDQNQIRVRNEYSENGAHTGDSYLYRYRQMRILEK